MAGPIEESASSEVVSADEASTTSESESEGTHTLRLKGPKHKVGDVTAAQISHVGFPVRGRLIEIPVNGDPVEVTASQHSAIMEQPLPSEAYSWDVPAESESAGGEVIEGAEGETAGKSIPQGTAVGGFEENPKSAGKSRVSGGPSLGSSSSGGPSSGGPGPSAETISGTGTTTGPSANTGANTTVGGSGSTVSSIGTAPDTSI